MLLRQLIPLAVSFARVNAGSSIAARIAMMAITTSNSISVKPACAGGLFTLAFGVAGIVVTLGVCALWGMGIQVTKFLPRQYAGRPSPVNIEKVRLATPKPVVILPFFYRTITYESRHPVRR
jgi:hypothetical protein